MHNDIQPCGYFELNYYGDPIYIGRMELCFWYFVAITYKWKQLVTPHPVWLERSLVVMPRSYLVTQGETIPKLMNQLTFQQTTNKH